MCVRAPMSLSVCVCAHVVFLTSVKWALASWFSRLAVTVLCNTVYPCRLPPADYRLPFYLCWSPIFDFCLSTRCSYAQCARRECNAPLRLCASVCASVRVCVFGHCASSWHKFFGKCCNFVRLFWPFFNVIFHLAFFNVRAKNQHQ